MRVYVECRSCGEKTYLDDVRDRRTEYPFQIRLQCSHCGYEASYPRATIEAEPSGNATAAGAVIGGLAGALAGPIGVPIGAGVGGVVGQNVDQEEQERIEVFYGSDAEFR